jgi:hypothetical protein
VTAAARALRLDEDRWRWLADEAKLGGAMMMVTGSHLVFAFDRFGWPDFAARPTTRPVLAGADGWLGLAAGCWAVMRLIGVSSASLPALIRLTGHALLPLLLLAIFIQVAAVMFAFTGVSRWPASFIALFFRPSSHMRWRGRRDSGAVGQPPSWQCRSECGWRWWDASCGANWGTCCRRRSRIPRLGPKEVVP